MLDADAEQYRCNEGGLRRVDDLDAHDHERQADEVEQRLFSAKEGNNKQA